MIFPRIILFAYVTDYFLSTNLTNLHELFAMNIMATCSVARISRMCAKPKLLNAMIGLVKIRATEQVAINTEDKEIRVDS